MEAVIYIQSEDNHAVKQVIKKIKKDFEDVYEVSLTFFEKP